MPRWPPLRLSCRLYTHAPSGAQRATHPCLDYYLGAIFMDRGGYKQLCDNMQATPPTRDEVRLRLAALQQLKRCRDALNAAVLASTC